MTFPIELLKNWFLRSRRTLPWRENPTPYRVWISEVMLQQTQVNVVLPYFERWMQAFPTIWELACAPLERVLKMWEGLGYYSRARHIHDTAKTVAEKYNGLFPDNEEALSTLKGLGPYTRGAILSFAFHKRKAAVDANVLRVMSRLFAIEESIDDPAVRKKIENLTEALLPNVTPWIIMEALIELGALICTKKSKCSECPLTEHCLGFRHGIQNDLPKKREKTKTVFLTRSVAVIFHRDKYLLEKRAAKQIMADLYEFPYLERQGDKLHLDFESSLKLTLKYIRPLKEQKHSFTHYRVHLFPHLFEAKSEDKRFLWKAADELEELPFSSGHRRILSEVLEW